MNTTGISMGTIKLTMKKAVRSAALSCLFMSCALTLPAFAGEHPASENTELPPYDSNVKNLQYDFNAGPETYTSYSLVRDIMQPVFKGTYADKNKPGSMNPLIAIAEFDLNNDKVVEIVARPVDTMDEPEFCEGEKLLCPNYVIDTSTGKPKIIGIIKAATVDRGDDIKNGYWTLKAFTRQNDPAQFSHYDIYSFDKKTGQYALDKTAAKTKPKP